MPEIAEVQTAKQRLRHEAHVRRDALSADARKAAAEVIAARAFPLPIWLGTIVSGFMPLKSEINPLPLMQKLAEQGVRLALPPLVGRGSPPGMAAGGVGALVARLARVGVGRSARSRPMGHPRAEGRCSRG